MKKHFGSFAALCLLVAGFGFTASSKATAQEQAGAATPPPTVLVINREFLKPGKAGSPHENAEGAFQHDMSQANSPDHYLGMVSLTGKPHALFFHGYDSYADWQKTVGSDMSNAALSQKIDGDSQADGELLTSMSTGVFEYLPDMSVRAPVDIPHMRFMEITEIKVRPGHEAEWNELSKLYNSIFGKVSNAHWAMYRLAYGDSSGIYLAISPMKSLADIDQDHKGSAQAFAAMSADQLKQMNDLEASAVESIGSSLFAFDPKMSYVMDKWKAEDPGFWGQK
ncbi:MAG: hypothetical protein WA708_09150 [Acidobacteriaceae bacterium]